MTERYRKGEGEKKVSVTDRERETVYCCITG